ncbi:MAG: penicillin-binding protein 2 [bacterium]|nr:penicillin-binding protein 2 [bacterium]
MLAQYSQISETQRKRSIAQRLWIVHGALLFCALIIVARLLELQVIKGEEYHAQAQAQHFGGVVLPAKRGEILSRNSKTFETSILATNTTLDMVYVDPLITESPSIIAQELSEILLTKEFHEFCASGHSDCPREFVEFYSGAFDPIQRLNALYTGALLEPIPENLPAISASEIPDLESVRRSFARNIEDRISEKRVTFVPLSYGATKAQMTEVADLSIPGVTVAFSTQLIYANPEQIDQSHIATISRRLSVPLEADADVIRRLLRTRSLRYVPIMRQLPPLLSSRLRERKSESAASTADRRKRSATSEEAQAIIDPLWSIALIPEHWRFYPDETVASHVIGFLNTTQEAQYGIERTFDPQLRGQEGLIRTLSDPSGGQILTAEQRVIDPRDGDSVILTIDRYIQREVERLMQDAVERFNADSGQAIVMEPDTGRILAMVNAPLFNSNNYGTVYEYAPVYLDSPSQKEIVVELYHPKTREFILRAYWGDLFTEAGRKIISVEKQQKITAVEILYNLKDVVRYYMYIGENSRREIFPTNRADIWLKYKNNIGVGAYLNRTIQEIYEPGSVMKPITMAIALDQGEVTPTDTYLDEEPVEVDEFTIRNVLNRYFGLVTMTNCLEQSINTCMTTVSGKLGRKLFHRMLERFGFSNITGIELEDELPGEMLPWRNWSNALLATSAYGQGISATPLQVITAFSALANGGRLMRPMIIDSILKGDGTVERSKPHIVDQVITTETSETISAMLVSSVDNGVARPAKVQGYKIAGKTGTSQIAGPGGQYEYGTGANITSFVGYAPIHNPEFIILVKFDRPRGDRYEYGSQTAAPIFKEIAAFLFKYYGIPPDDNG